MRSLTILSSFLRSAGDFTVIGVNRVSTTNVAIVMPPYREKLPSRVDPQDHDRLRHPLDGADQGGRSELHALVPRGGPDLAEGPHHEPLQPLVDLLLAPAERLEVLEPFEVRDHHAAGAGQDVGHDH